MATSNKRPRFLVQARSSSLPRLFREYQLDKQAAVPLAKIWQKMPGWSKMLGGAAVGGAGFALGSNAVSSVASYIPGSNAAAEASNQALGESIQNFSRQANWKPETIPSLWSSPAYKQISHLKPFVDAAAQASPNEPLNYAQTLGLAHNAHLAGVTPEQFVPRLRAMQGMPPEPTTTAAQQQPAIPPQPSPNFPKALRPALPQNTDPNHTPAPGILGWWNSLPREQQYIMGASLLASIYGISADEPLPAILGAGSIAQGLFHNQLWGDKGLASGLFHQQPAETAAIQAPPPGQPPATQVPPAQIQLHPNEKILSAYQSGKRDDALAMFVQNLKNSPEALKNYERLKANTGTASSVLSMLSGVPAAQIELIKKEMPAIDAALAQQK